MKIDSRTGSACAFLILVGFSLPGLSQEANTTRNVILRRDPSTSSPVLAHLPKGARVTLVDAGPDGGFDHVRTEDDQIGWVFARYIKVMPVEAPSGAGPGTPSEGGSAGPSAATCDTGLWQHVYHSNRLIVRQQCLAVTGTVVDATAGREPDGVRHEADGDTHGWLRVDPEFQNLLNAGNNSAEGGNLVFEIICRFPVTQKDAQSACQGYQDHVQLPAIGSHVRIVGSYVQDTFHAKWNEIHPVTSISVIP